MNRLLCKSMLLVLFMLVGTVAPGGQTIAKSVGDVFEITHGDISDAKKPSKYKSLIDIQSSVFLSQLNDDVVYIEIKIHNKSKQDIVIESKDIKAAMSVEIIGADGRSIARGTPCILELLGDKLPMLIKPGEDAMFVLMVKHIKRWSRLDISIYLFDLSEDIQLKKK